MTGRTTIPMNKLNNALATTALSLVDIIVDAIPDPELKLKLKTLTYAVKIPYAFFKELLPTEADEFIKELMQPGKISDIVIHSSEFQQALGNTLQNLAYVNDREKREIIKKAFTGAYISQDEYAKKHLDRLQETAQRISIPALQHLLFIKRDILPLWLRRVDELSNVSNVLPGYTLEEFKALKRRTTAISLVYDSWYEKRKQEVTAAFNRSDTQDTRKAYDLSGADESKHRTQFMEYWDEYASFGIFRQGNDPSIGTYGGGSGTVRYLTQFGEEFIKYLEGISKAR